MFITADSDGLGVFGIFSLFCFVFCFFDFLIYFFTLKTVSLCLPDTCYEVQGELESVTFLSELLEHWHLQSLLLHPIQKALQAFGTLGSITVIKEIKMISVPEGLGEKGPAQSEVKSISLRSLLIVSLQICSMTLVICQCFL